MALKCSPESVILEDDFCTFSATSISCKLSLTERVLYIDFLSKSKSDTIEEILLSDVIGCRVLKSKQKGRDESKDICAYLTIYTYPLKIISGILSKQLRRERKAVTFEIGKFQTLDENLNLANKWQRAISYLIRGFSCLKNGS